MCWCRSRRWPSSWAALRPFSIFAAARSDGAAGKGSLKVQNPFSLTEAAKFAALFAVVLLAVKIVQEHFPPSGLYAVAALAGLTDVDAITLSMSEFAKSGDAARRGDRHRHRGADQHAGEMRHGLLFCRPSARQAAA